MTFDEHPTVMRYRSGANGARPAALTPDQLREICLSCGADDVGFVSLERAEIARQRDAIVSYFPQTRTLISIVCRMNRDNIRRPMRSIANVEFHHSTEHVDGVACAIVSKLEALGFRAVNGGAAGFPMEADRWGSDQMWIISHKPIAEAAGLGTMGIHRNVIHPKFGNFITLGTILTDFDVVEESRPLDYNPCLECKLCVAACPTGAIGADGSFNFASCYTHNYREFMGGFEAWTDSLVESKNISDHRKRVTSSETISMWQSLSFGANYKAAYCMAVCPAGEDVIGPFLEHRKAYLDDVVKPLREKRETVYVIRGSDAERYVRRHFPHKAIKQVDNALPRSTTIAQFLGGLPLAFQGTQAEGLDAVYHFSFTGSQSADATITIRNERLSVEKGLIGKPNLYVIADGETWLAFLRKETNLVAALLKRKIRMKGQPRLLLKFGRCFP